MWYDRRWGGIVSFKTNQNKNIPRLRRRRRERLRRLLLFLLLLLLRRLFLLRLFLPRLLRLRLFSTSVAIISISVSSVEEVSWSMCFDTASNAASWKFSIGWATARRDGFYIHRVVWARELDCEGVMNRYIICTHDMHTLTSDRTPGTTASTAKVAEANSGNFMLY